MSSDDLSVILVHGAWADGSSWSKVIAPLQQRGHRVLTAPIPLTSLSDDLAALRIGARFDVLADFRNAAARFRKGGFQCGMTALESIDFTQLGFSLRAADYAREDLHLGKEKHQRGKRAKPKAGKQANQPAEGGRRHGAGRDNENPSHRTSVPPGSFPMC